MGIPFTLESSVEETTHLYRDVSIFKGFWNNSSICFQKQPSQLWTLVTEWVQWLYFKRDFYVRSKVSPILSITRLPLQRTAFLSGFLPNNLSPKSHEFRSFMNKCHNGCLATRENGHTFNLENFSGNSKEAKEGSGSNSLYRNRENWEKRRMAIKYVFITMSSKKIF